MLNVELDTKKLQKLAIQVDRILREEIKNCQMKPSFFEARIFDSFVVGVQGDERTYEHPAEITPDSLESINKIKKMGINIYNQQVFTYYNSKKFESCLLRKTLKKSGIDPYYLFNAKGKDETIDYRVPIARIEQERKEEARFLPGIVRIDNPVFNVPRLGKSQLGAWQNHEVIMILYNGRRVYRFYPWESKYALVEPYNYVDVSIFDYIKRLKDDGEDIDEYSSIWYYF